MIIFDVYWIRTMIMYNEYIITYNDDVCIIITYNDDVKWLHIMIKYNEDI